MTTRAFGAWSPVRSALWGSRFTRRVTGRMDSSPAQRTTDGLLAALHERAEHWIAHRHVERQEVHPVRGVEEARSAPRRVGVPVLPHDAILSAADQHHPVP